MGPQSILGGGLLPAFRPAPSVGEPREAARSLRPGGGASYIAVPCDCRDCSDTVPATGSEGGALGSLTGYCPDRGKQAAAVEPRSLDGLVSGFRLRAQLRSVASDRRIGVCGSRVYTDPGILVEDTADGQRRARWTGVVLCNRAGCPVCGPAKVRRFRDQVSRTLGAGGLWQHVILTVRHSPGDSWLEVYERLMSGVRGLSHGPCGRVVMTAVEATIRATETTYSVRSGWHVHLHVLWRVRRELLPEERRIVAAQWAADTGAHPEHGCRFGAEFDCSDAGNRQSAAHYLSKLAAEMTDFAKTAQREHWTLGELYRVAAERGGRWIGLVREYQAATKGRRLYQLDRRSRILHDSAPELPELAVISSYTVIVDREEFAILARAERAGHSDATYLPLEVAIRARGDPSSWVEDTILSLSSQWGRKLQGQS